MMLNVLKRLVREPLPPHVHFHLDDQGNEVLCDASACRPQPAAVSPLLVPFR